MFKEIFKKTITIVPALLLIFSAVFGFPQATDSQLSGNIPFGGKVALTIFCPCTHNFLLTFVPSFGIPTSQLLYSPFSANGEQSNGIGIQAYQSYNLPVTGVWAVGFYTPGGKCDILVAGECATLPAPAGTITSTVGTSPTF